jgi:hypothetical protein
MIVKIFWQEKCPNCPQAKALGKSLELEHGLDVIYYNTKEPDGLAEAVMFDVMSTPSVIVCDAKGSEIIGWRGLTPSVDDIMKIEKKNR